MVWHLGKLAKWALYHHYRLILSRPVVAGRGVGKGLPQYRTINKQREARRISIRAAAHIALDRILDKAQKAAAHG